MIKGIVVIMEEKEGQSGYVIHDIIHEITFYLIN